MTGRLRRFAVGAGVGALALALGVGVAVWNAKAPDASALLALSLPDTQGTAQPLRQWRGKVLVVNFWATWCEPCREEMPEFIRVQRELGPQGVQFVGIAVDSADKVGRFARQLELNYPALVAGYDAIDLSKPLGNPLLALPFTVIVGRDGQVALTHVGPINPAQLRSTIAKLI